MVLKLFTHIFTPFYVWEWCKNVWYWNLLPGSHNSWLVWEWCKNVWYWNTVLTYPFSEEFENDVKTYGTETQIVTLKIYQAFENDVKMYGTETLQPIQYVPACLRMMWKCMVLKHRFDSYSIHWCLKMM